MQPHKHTRYGKLKNIQLREVTNGNCTFKPLLRSGVKHSVGKVIPHTNSLCSLRYVMLCSLRYVMLCSPCSYVMYRHRQRAAVQALERRTVTGSLPVCRRWSDTPSQAACRCAGAGATHRHRQLAAVQALERRPSQAACRCAGAGATHRHRQSAAV